MDDIPESIDFKVRTLSGCQSKTAEDDGISQEKGSQIIGGRLCSGVKSNMSRSFSEGSFLDKGQSKRRFSYNSPFGMESRLRYWRNKRRFFIIFDKFSYSYFFKSRICQWGFKIKLISLTWGCLYKSAVWSVWGCDFFQICFSFKWRCFQILPIQSSMILTVFQTDGKCDHADYFPFIVIILNFNWPLFSFTGRRRELSLRARLRS